MLQKIIRHLMEDATDGLKHDVEAYANKVLKQMMRTLVLAGVGVTFLAVGSVFLLVGVVASLSKFMFSGLAWGLVGLIVALVGGVLVLLIRR
ncbi:MAG: phage holin family protein [Thaumarchaeota archaeon]|nr:phage holin family protein [Nitrososphaerota archaeon]